MCRIVMAKDVTVLRGGLGEGVYSEPLHEEVGMKEPAPIPARLEEAWCAVVRNERRAKSFIRQCRA